MKDNYNHVLQNDLEVSSLTPVTGFSVVACKNKIPPWNTKTTVWSPQDINAHHGGKYVYIGMQHEEERLPVTTIDFLIQDVKGPRTGVYWKACDVDLNSGAGGKYIYITWRTGEIGKKPILDVMFIESRSSSPPEYPGRTAIHKDLCSGAGGSYIYAYYQRDD